MQLVYSQSELVFPIRFGVCFTNSVNIGYRIGRIRYHSNQLVILLPLVVSISALLRPYDKIYQLIPMLSILR